MRTDADLTNTMKSFADTVWRVCTLYMSPHDAEDAFQNTFLRYATSDDAFDDDEHRRAWLIRVASNLCKDHLKSGAARTDPTDAKTLVEIGDSKQHMVGGRGQDVSDPGDSLEPHPIRTALASLPLPYREVLYLVYFEGYVATEVAELLGKPVNTVYTHIARGKKMLGEVLEND